MTEHIVDTYEHAGLTVRIFQEEIIEEFFNPRTDQTNLGIMLCGHRNYNLGDDGSEYGIDPMAYDTIEELIERVREIAVGPILTLGLLDHSGISMYVGGSAHPSDPGGWDSGAVGVIFATRETLDETGAPEDQIEKQLTAEVKEYDLYLRGEVYGFDILDADGEPIESVGGFIGLSYIREQANESAEGCARYIERERQEAAYWAARDVMTV